MNEGEGIIECLSVFWKTDIQHPLDLFPLLLFVIADRDVVHENRIRMLI
jgi:hypothetical protein